MSHRTTRINPPEKGPKFQNVERLGHGIKGKEKMKRTTGAPKRLLVGGLVGGLAAFGLAYCAASNSGSDHNTSPSKAPSDAHRGPNGTAPGCELTVRDKRHGGPATVLGAMHQLDLPRTRVPHHRVNDHLWTIPGLLQVEIKLGPNHVQGAKPDINLVNPKDKVVLAPSLKQACDNAHGIFLGHIAQQF